MPQIYNDEFRQKIVCLHLQEGRTYKSLAAKYRVYESMYLFDFPPKERLYLTSFMSYHDYHWRVVQDDEEAIPYLHEFRQVVCLCG